MAPLKGKANDFKTKNCYLSEEFFRDFFDNASCIVLQLQTHLIAVLYCAVNSFFYGK